MSDLYDIQNYRRPRLRDNLNELIERLESIPQEPVRTVGAYARGNMDFFEDEWHNLRNKNIKPADITSVTKQRPMTSLFLSIAFLVTWFPIFIFVIFVTISIVLTFSGFVFVESSLIGLALVALVIVLFLPVCFAGMITCFVVLVHSLFRFCCLLFFRFILSPLTVLSYYCEGVYQLRLNSR